MITPRTWFLLPIGVVILAVLLLAATSGPGLDGAARSTAIVFWFLPLIAWLGFKCFTSFNLLKYSLLKKIILILLWLIPSIPLSLMSLYGLLLISDVGFGVLF